MVYVIADDAALTGGTDAAAAKAAGQEQTAPGEAAAADPAGPAGATPTTAHCRRPMSFVLGGGVLPTALLADLTAGARHRTVRHPGEHTAPQTRYVPSRALADYIRCRDLTCRFSGCDTPADRADIDHTIPWPFGPTHASKLTCWCAAGGGRFWQQTG